MLTHIILLYVFLALFSLAVGSFLNVLIHRLPIILKTEWERECQILFNKALTPDNTINLFIPRSFCPQCNNTIPFWHNLPLISYCILRARCIYCNQTISWRYPLVELLSLLLALFAAWQFGFTLTLLFVLLYLWLLIAICFIDLKHQLIPDSLSLSLLWLGLIANTYTLFTPLPNAVLSAAGAYIGLWLFMYLFYFVTGKVGMGHGDFKLFAAFGAWFGWSILPFILLISSILGVISGLIYLKTTHQNRNTPIPYGPFLCLSGVGAVFYGDTLIQWYLGLF